VSQSKQMLTRDGLQEHAFGTGNGADHSSPDTMQEEDVQRIIRDLAQLSVLKYELQRAGAAALLKCRVTLLDSLVESAREKTPSSTAQGQPLDWPDPVPWPDLVDGQTLLYDIRDLLHRHIVLPVGAGWVIAFWCLHSFLMDVAVHTPRLAVISPEKRCGKSTLLDLLSRLVYRPILASNLTTATAFRVIDRAQPTLLIDELDTFIRGNEELRGVLNAGHRYDGFVLRCIGDDFEVRKFRVFAAIACGLIGQLPSTLHDRSIKIRMRRADPTEFVGPINNDTHCVANELMRKAATWAAANRELLVDSDPRLPRNMWNRVADNWPPLFAIAEAIGGDMPLKLADSANVLVGQDITDPQSLGIMLLEDIRIAFREACVERLPSADLCERLRRMEERPWVAFGKRDRPLTQRRLAQILEPFQIFSGNIRIGSGVPKGYLREQFEDAWSRYLAPEENGSS
jgi:putative DNA primase/helicase